MSVSNNHSDTATLEVLLERFTKQRLPHAQALLEKAEGGEALNDFDMAFLSSAMADLQKAQPIYGKHPEYHNVCTKITALYVRIVDLAAKNNQARP